MPFEDIITVAQGGAVVMLTAAVVALWRRLNAVTDRMTAYLEDRALDGDNSARRTLEK